MNIMYLNPKKNFVNPFGLSTRVCLGESKSSDMSIAIRGCASVGERVNSINLSGLGAKLGRLEITAKNLHVRPEPCPRYLHRPKNPHGLIGRNRYRAPVIACSISSGPALKLERL